jgi:OmcA/MtrC family decaheme c-type cytochrome
MQGIWRPIGRHESRNAPDDMKHWLWILAVSAAACEGGDGPIGPGGTPGGEGQPGDDGEPGGGDGDGGDDVSPWLTGGAFAVEVQAAAIDGEGASVTFRLTDGDDVPLDREGLLTEGAVDLAFGLSWLAETDGEPGQYTSYITRVATDAVNGDQATQATTEASGTFEAVDLVDGVYRYTFATPITDARADRTHTVLISGSRDLDGVAQRVTALYNFLPSGAPASTTREIVTDASCGGCHGAIEAHGGHYSGVAACITCHTPQTTDPDTDNTLDFPVMLHRIHRGESLPTVEVNQVPYEIIGYGGVVHDFSTVVFPQDIGRCDSCHEGAQGDRWKDSTYRNACLACHDRTSFVDPPPAGMDLHGGGPPPDGMPLAQYPCAVCHPPSGGLAGVVNEHLQPAFDPASPQVDITILDVTNRDPGQSPTIQFSVQFDGAPRDILVAPMTRLRALWAGPNTDIAAFLQTTAQGTGATGTLAAVDAPNGVFSYTFPAGVTNALPVSAAGNYTVAFEGTIQPVNPGPTYVARSPMHPFRIGNADATPATARRVVVDSAKCDGCHYILAAHGGGRTGAQYCPLCHNPNNANDERVAHFETGQVFTNSVDFKVMIHRIHAGENLSQPYILGGNPTPNRGVGSALLPGPGGTPVNFGETRFPRALTDCSGCHVDGTFELPLGPDVLPSLTQVRGCTELAGADVATGGDLEDDNLCDGTTAGVSNWVAVQSILVPPETAVCTSCHDAPSVAAHAEVMTTTGGAESCATCHGPGAELDVRVVHAR